MGDGIVTENRKTFRFRTNRLAKIFPNAGGAIECLVRDMSTWGARLEVEDPEQVPKEFFLRIQGLSDKFRCHVIWRIENVIGVQYLYL